MKIGFTCGAFDVLHEGHTNFLNKCFQECDYLIVGLVSDYIIRVQKGHERPCQSYELRCTRLTEHLNERYKEYKVIPVDTFDMSHYIACCDVWFKGIDQKNMKPFNSDKIHLINRTPNISTTEILKGRGL